MNLYLIGYRCTGKTAVAKGLARRLGRRFVDTDEWIVTQAERSIADMVAERGWDFFREKESRVLKAIGTGKHQVVATGGGIVLRRENRLQMVRTGATVWLSARPATIRDRMLGDAHGGASRPNLTDMGLEDEIRTTLQQRIPLYAQVSDFALATDFLDVEAVCRAIETWVEQVGV